MGQSQLCGQAYKNILNSDLPEYIKIVKKADYICTKCGRVANTKKVLCESKRIKKKKLNSKK
jgi:hypothetical protein